MSQCVMLQERNMGSVECANTQYVILQERTWVLYCVMLHERI
jgi:hypothetical protein